MNQDEKFGESIGNIRIEENGCVAIHMGSRRSDAFIRGICEYSLGKHKLRFLETDMKISTYSWCSNDNTIPLHADSQVSKDFRDMRYQTKFEIELLLDCDNQKIIYFNQQTKNKREMNIDVTICPFPWQLLFYPHAVEDCIQLISTSEQV
ncbi:unnamed protein product [Rotaria sp. Silwood1]|nr:unnamed protein product [Rotaria sp. Silwood1]CAF4979278.1 unnamed protein product [Rotaria sp. Silwood1]